MSYYTKTFDEALPELKAIAKELNITLNDWRVIKEWLRRNKPLQTKQANKVKNHEQET